MKNRVMRLHPKLPAESGGFSLVIENAAGKRIRNLVANKEIASSTIGLPLGSHLRFTVFANRFRLTFVDIKLIFNHSEYNQSPLHFFSVVQEI
jgi:hypothetical protein